MPEPAANAPETEAKKSRGLGSYVGRLVIWAFVAAVVYVLGSGPVMLLVEKDFLDGRIFVIYAPLSWAYRHTPLHKPLGLYAHLWVPDWVDKNGNDGTP